MFGWAASDVKIFTKPSLYLRVDDGQFILCHESSKPLVCPGFDHLGLLMDTPEEVDEILAKCEAWRIRDDRVEIINYDDLVTGNVTVHAFYVRYLLPINFDVQSQTFADGHGPENVWRYAKV